MSHYQQSYITLHYVTDKIYKAPLYWIGQDCQKNVSRQWSHTGLKSSVFTARCYASAVLAMGLCPSVSVSVCLCLSQVVVLLKQLNLGSQKQHHTIAQGIWFSEAKDLREIQPGHPLPGRQMQVGWVKIGDFWQITGYISKTANDRHIVSTEVE